jgi:hypothetical protein
MFSPYLPSARPPLVRLTGDKPSQESRCARPRSLEKDPRRILPPADDVNPSPCAVTRPPVPGHFPPSLFFSFCSCSHSRILSRPKSLVFKFQAVPSSQSPVIGAAPCGTLAPTASPPPPPFLSSADPAAANSLPCILQLFYFTST